MAANGSSWNVSERHASRLCAQALSLCTFLQVGTAVADGASSCIDANNAGNELRQQGQLTAAKEQFLKCAEPSCPAIIRDECARLVSEVELNIPTVVFAAIDPHGNDVGAIKIFIDKEQLEPASAGRAVAVDPGEHRIRIVAADGRVAEGTVVAREGEKNRRVRFELPPIHEAREVARTSSRRAAPLPTRDLRPPAGKPHTLAWVLGGVGVAALGSFAYFAIKGQQLEGDCAPQCRNDEVDEIYRDYLVADISLGVGVLAMGAATYLFLGSSSKSARAAITVLPARAGAGLGTLVLF